MLMLNKQMKWNEIKTKQAKRKKSDKNNDEAASRRRMNYIYIYTEKNRH